MKRLGIYVHVPFCKRKCNYCDFYSIKWNREVEERYVKSLVKEINSYNGMEYVVDTIFFGGGTPTIIEPQNIEKIIHEIKNNFKVDKNSEITIEANPNTLTYENLSVYKKAGINRLSIGVQSLNNNILENIGRLHNSEEALLAIKRAKETGYENINVDVMFNIPGQTTEDIEETVIQIIDEEVNHISFYSLKLEKGTPMFSMERDHKIFMPEENIEREMYYTGRKIMEDRKIYQYEISNFAKKGFECKHNLKYWNQEEYIGFGPSAHSFLNNERYGNVSNINEFCNNAENNIFNRNIHESLNAEALEFEYIMLKLRLTEGLSLNIFNQKFNIDFNDKYSKQIEYLIGNKLLIYNENNIKLTQFGMDISNFVFEKFMI
ncbi:oxygen-independent coproporphyrinogen-3 oxidase [Sedimentibacter acidaminivorans]|uniref:Heme chaperone HemW n=1 Tax=Sedimentibacter acidaminivorans TaxID=913099 RepID=A0ABS4GJ14_9FIRM|nr:radical SAM family heme chaperone HemW [Sedimentibacter acidaminivorans]MBP1927345.1 oxygen-independent coproporphyrinogen-3 oxidase [Sedimentibacter acidaminivorans]